MQKILSLLTIALTLGILVAGCLPGSAPAKTVFHPGDPTATPPGSEITDPDFQIGVAAYKIKDPEQVRESMEKVIRRSPQLAPPYWYLGQAQVMLGDYVGGLEQMNKALSIDPNYALAYADRGRINLDLGNESQGFADLQHALELDPSLAKAHHNLGAYYHDHGQLDLSLQEFELALEIDPGRASAWESRAEVLHQLGRLEDCIDSATHAIDIDQQDWTAYEIRAFCYAEIGKPEQASADLSVIVKNNPQDADMSAKACAMATDAGANDRAIEYCTQSMALDPGRYESIINRGVAYFNSGSYSKALDDFSSALELGEIPLAYSNRGNAHMKLFQYREAVNDYEKSLELYPNGYVYYSLGFAYTQLREYEKARAAFEQGDILEPERSSEASRLWGKAQVYDKLGQVDLALELYTQLIDQYRRTEAYYFRGRIYEAKGMQEEALADYQMFLDLAGQMLDDSYVQMLAYDANKRLEGLKK